MSVKKGDSGCHSVPLKYILQQKPKELISCVSEPFPVQTTRLINMQELKARFPKFAFGFTDVK